ncbi:MAG: NAD(+) synthase [Candidatus Latescibacterota bacterium]|nr:MAG: NAD(+) synthase [Candidatus Latescibacterota bacterium]
MSLSNAIQIDPAATCESLATYIREQHDELKRDGVVLGLSGGLDSAVAAALCCRAVGRENVLAILMPERDSEPRHERDARDLAHALQIQVKKRSITPILRHFGIYRWMPTRLIPRTLLGKLIRGAYRYHERKSGTSPFADGLDGVDGKKHGAYLARGNAYYRIKHRIRMVELYYVADKENRLVVGAPNKTEWMTGFFVKFGCDHAADISPIIGLYKTQVISLARHLEIPEALIEKPPSPDLLPGLTDEFALGISYQLLDLVLLGLERGMGTAEIAADVSAKSETVESVRELVRASKHMRETLPG